MHRRGRRVVLPAGPPARAFTELREGSWLDVAVELISGAITRLGRRHGVPTPANQAMYALLGALAPAESPG